jgi:hypothetical protein
MTEGQFDEGLGLRAFNLMEAMKHAEVIIFNSAKEC